MRTTASSCRTVMGTTGVSLSFSLAAARPYIAGLASVLACLCSSGPCTRLRCLLHCKAG